MPGPPSIVTVSSELTRLSVTLSPPIVTNGILLEYKVTWATDVTFTSPKHIGQSFQEGSVVVINGLDPDTQFFIKVSFIQTCCSFFTFYKKIRIECMQCKNVVRNETRTKRFLIYKLFYLQASARTSAGEGAESEVRNASTLRSLPDPPQDVTSDLSSRNQSCLKLTWETTDTDVYEYNVSRH